jgi:hypothetical protein
MPMRVCTGYQEMQNVRRMYWDGERSCIICLRRPSDQTSFISIVKYTSHLSLCSPGRVPGYRLLLDTKSTSVRGRKILMYCPPNRVVLRRERPRSPYPTDRAMRQLGDCPHLNCAPSLGKIQPLSCGGIVTTVIKPFYHSTLWGIHVTSLMLY